MEGTLISLHGAFCHHRDEKRSSKLHFPLVCCYRGDLAAGSSCAKISGLGLGRTGEAWLGLQALTLCRARALDWDFLPWWKRFFLVYYSVLISCTSGLEFIWACEGKERKRLSFCLDKSITKQLSVQRGLLGLHRSCLDRSVNRCFVLEVFMQKAS